MKKMLFAFIILLCANANLSVCLGAEKDGRQIVINAMKDELNRSMEKLKMEEFESPYFISYRIRDIETITINGKYGSVTSDFKHKDRSAYVEVRVGDYKFDNTERKNQRYDFSNYGYIPGSSYFVPIENNPPAIRSGLWYLTDLKYKKALDDYLKKKGEKIFSVEKEHVDDFSIEEKHIYYGEEIELQFDKSVWEERVRGITDYLGKIRDIYESQMNVSAEKRTNFFVNSEGSEIIEENIFYSISISAKVKAEDGMPITNNRSYSVNKYEEIPDYELMMQDAEELVSELFELQKAEEMKPYTGPAILDPSVTGIIFHEAIGHRLEGERQKREESGQTFKDKIGEKIIPEFLTVLDDPTLKVFNNRSLFGNYKYDSEGIPAQKVVLVESGILKNYLLSRTPIKGFNKSNGHGRSSGSSFYGDPVGRMATIIVKSDNGYSYEELKRKLIAECKEQGKRYGFVIKNATGGETSTQRGGIQAFKQSPVLVYTVDVETGQETLVRGVEIVGTPLSSINKITAAGSEYEVFNGYCRAESGVIPVSTIAPWVLTREVELQKSSQRKSKPPLLPAPYHDR